MTPTVITIDTPGLGDRSYFAHDGEVALVVDPQRDIDRVLEVARTEDVRITHVFETHVHNDYVSGGLGLARRVSAVVVASADDDLRFEHHGVRDGDEVRVGTMGLRARHTPGHTHSHLSYELRDDRGTVHAVFTGGALLYGTVGRTDLLGDEHTDELTRSQWCSVRRLTDELADDVSVYPTHGFGSFCSARSGADRDRGTIGDEKEENIAVRIDDVDEFVEELLAGLGDHPAYYAHMSLLNQAGPIEPDLSPAVPVDPTELRRRLEAGEWVIDLRDRRAYAHNHLVGATNFAVDGPFVTYLGWLVPWGSRLTLTGHTAEQVAEAQRELVRIGIDRPAGAAAGAVSEIAGDHPVSGYRVGDFAALAAARREGQELRVIDVRRREEYAEGHVDGALNLPIHELFDHLHHVPDDQLWVHCASGARAAIAASLLERAGFDVVLIDDDFDAAADQLS